MTRFALDAYVIDQQAYAEWYADLQFLADELGLAYLVGHPESHREGYEDGNTVGEELNWQADAAGV